MIESLKIEKSDNEFYVNYLLRFPVATKFLQNLASLGRSSSVKFSMTQVSDLKNKSGNIVSRQINLDTQMSFVVLRRVTNSQIISFADPFRRMYHEA